MSAKQEWYDENRSLFDAQTTTAPVAIKKCVHRHLYRATATEVRCKQCHAGWVDGGIWKLDNGKVIT